MFEQDKYYKYIKTLEGITIAIYVIIILIFVLLFSLTRNGFAIIIGGILGFFTAYLNTLLIKMKIQKMKWEMDIYNKIREIAK